MEYINIQCNKVNEKIILFAESSQFIVIKVQKNFGALVGLSFLIDIYGLLCKNGSSF
jgi:hypothetical protein